MDRDQHGRSFSYLKGAYYSGPDEKQDERPGGCHRIGVGTRRLEFFPFLPVFFSHEKIKIVPREERSHSFAVKI